MRRSGPKKQLNLFQLLLAALLWGSAHLEAEAFAAPPSHLARRGFRAGVSRVNSAEGAAEEVAPEPEEYDLLPSEEESAPAGRDESEIARAADLKRQLYQLARMPLPIAER